LRARICFSRWTHGYFDDLAGRALTLKNPKLPPEKIDRGFNLHEEVEPAIR